MDDTYGKIGGLIVKKLSMADLDAALELQDSVYDSMPDKANFVLTTREEFTCTIDMDFAVGAFDGDILAAVSTMVVNRETDRNVGYVCGYDPGDCVTYDTTFVRGNYRGKGIQRYFIPIKDKTAASLGAKYAFATVSPNNSFSLNNLLSSGFEIVDRRIMYNGADRFVLKKELKISGKEA